MKNGLIMAICLGIIAGGSAFLGYSFGYQAAEVEYEKALGKAAIKALCEKEANKDTDSEAPQE